MHKKLQISYAFCRFMILTVPAQRLPVSENAEAGRVRFYFSLITRTAGAWTPFSPSFSVMAWVRSK